MPKVLHYKTNYLNRSETFINRLVSNHQTYNPIALCYHAKTFTENIDIYESPKKGFSKYINNIAFHLNLPLPYYYQVIEKNQPDVIHAHFGFDAMKMVRLANYFNIPLIVSFYGSDVSRLPSELFWKQRYKKLSESGSHFIAATEFMKQQLIDLGFSEDKISVVRFGVDLNLYTFSNTFQKSNKLMMVGRMVEKKGFRYAIKAVAKLKEKGINAELNLYGNGPLMNELTELTHKLSLNGSVTFHGYQPIEKILEAHSEHSFLLAPSITAQDGDMEGLPNTILEAMAKGTLVIASKHAAIPEVIEHRKTGFLVKERDASEISNLLEELFEGNFNLDEIRMNAREMIQKEYNVVRMVSEIEQIYTKELENE